MHSDKDLPLARKSIFGLNHGIDSTTGAVRSAIGDLSEYALHTHDLLADNLDNSRRGTRESLKGGSRRATKDRDKLTTRNPRPESFAFDSAPADRVLSSAGRGSRWAHSVADISRLLAFQTSQQKALRQQEQKQRHSNPASPTAATRPPWKAATAAAASAPGSTAAGPGHKRSGSAGSSLDAESFGGHTATAAAAVAAAAVAAGGLSSGLDDSGDSVPGSPRAYDSSGTVTSPGITPSHTPPRMLSPINSRNARTPAALPSLDTLHEESHTNVSHGTSGDGAEQRSPAPIRTRTADPSIVAADSNCNMPASPRVGIAITADLDPSDLTSNSRSGSPRNTQAAGHGSPSGHGSPLQRHGSGNLWVSRGGSPFGQADASGVLHRQGHSMPPQRPQQLQSSRPTMARQLLSFLSGKRLSIDPAGQGEAAELSESTPAGRQRSLSEGAGLAQRLHAYRNADRSTRETFSSSSPGSMREASVCTGSHSIAIDAGAPPAAHFGAIPPSGLGSDVAAAAGRQPPQAGSFAHWDSVGGPIPTGDVGGALSAQNARRHTMQDVIQRLTLSRSNRQTSDKLSVGAMHTKSGTANDLIPAKSGFSAASAGSKPDDGALGTSGRRLASLFSWNGW